jgi:hypothetical protein
MAHAQKPDFVFRRNGRVHLNRQGRQFSRLLAGELCTSACRVCTARASLCSAVMWRWLVTHSILLVPLHFSSRASPCDITFQTQSTTEAPPYPWHSAVPNANFKIPININNLLKESNKQNGVTLATLCSSKQTLAHNVHTNSIREITLSTNRRI